MNKLIEPIYDLLKDRSRWIKGSLAIDKTSTEVEPDAEGAVCWCLAGAIRKIYDKEERVVAVRMLIQDQIGGSIVLYNDAAQRTHADVLNMLKAIP